MKVQAILTTTGGYALPDGRTIQREYQGETPNGNPFAGRWVLRDAAGTFIDFDQYINDLAERHQVDLYAPEGPVLTTRQQSVVDYLQGKEWISPTEIGRAVWGKGHHSASASPVCKKLVAMGLLARSDQGHYKVLN